MKTVLGLWLLSLSVVAVAKSPAYAPVDVEMAVKQVSAHAYYVEGVAGIATDNAGFISNAGFVVTDAGVVVIDALGTPSLADKLIRKIEALTDQPIVRVIATHYHADHILGLQAFADRGIEIWAPSGARDYLESGVGAERLEERKFSLEPWVAESTTLVWPDFWIEAEVSFELAGVQITVTNLGAAHSKGDLSVYIEPDGVLYSGDLIFEGRTPFVGDANSARWLEQLSAMADRQLTALVPGHGAVASRPTEAVAATRDYLAYLRKTMASAVDELQEFDEAYAAADWSGFAHWPAFEEANRVNAYQVFLSLEAESVGGP